MKDNIRSFDEIVSQYKEDSRYEEDLNFQHFWETLAGKILSRGKKEVFDHILDIRPGVKWDWAYFAQQAKDSGKQWLYDYIISITPE